MIFDWDEANRKHIARHDVTTAEVEQVLRNEPVDLEEQCIDGEHRYTQAGETNAGRILVIVATLRGNSVRPISAWDATAATKRDYLQKKGAQHGFLP